MNIDSTESTSISVIITTYNRNDRLELALISVLEQNFLPTEVLIVNDGDQVVFNEWWAYFKPKQKQQIEEVDIKIFHTSIKGANPARKIGFEKSKGAFIAFLDDDDIWLPNKLENQLKCFESNPEAILVTSNFIQINKHEERLRKISLSKRIIRNDLLFRNTIGGFSFPLIRREVLDSHYFVEDLQSSQDWNVWLKIMADNPGKKILNTSSFEILYLIDDINKNKISSSPTKRINGYTQVLEINKEVFPSYMLKWHFSRINGISRGEIKLPKIKLVANLISSKALTKAWMGYLIRRYFG